MWWWLAIGLAGAGEGSPTVHLSWRGAATTLWVRGPEGEHVAEDAPYDLQLVLGDQEVRRVGLGIDLTKGLGVGTVRGAAIEGRVSVSLCEDGGTACRLVTVGVSGQASDTRRDSVTLTVGEPPAPGLYLLDDPVDGGSSARRPHPAFPRQADAAAVHAAAQASAVSRGVPLLLDFGAVWCPPCQDLHAEILHADPAPPVLSGLERAWIDVDDPSSWPLKDRYAVGGYPTLVAVDPEDGAVLARLVGYPGREATLAWMQSVADGRSPGEGVADLEALDAETAARRAWQAVRSGRMEDAAVLLDRAAEAGDTVPFRLARWGVSPSLEDGRWLADHQVSALDWVLGFDAEGAEPALVEVVVQATRDALPEASPRGAAELFGQLASLRSDDAEARVLYGAAARSLAGAMTGDRHADKGLIAWMAWLEEKSGNPAGALGRLEAARAAFSQEPTFHLSTARLMLRLGMSAEAVVVARAAVDTSWGDNTLTAAALLSRAWLALDRREDAQRVVDETLARLPVPEEGTDVRTHRLREALRATLDGAE